MRCSTEKRLLIVATFLVATSLASPLFAQSSLLTPSSPSLAPSLRTTLAFPPGTFEPERSALRTFAAETQEWHHARTLLSPGDLRRLDLEYVRYTLQTEFVSDPFRDPFYDRTRDRVRGAYVKMYREILERQYPLDDLVDDALAYRDARRGGSGSRSAAPDEPSWRMKVSPRVAIGSNGYLGTRLSMPYTGITGLDRMSLNVRHGVFDGEWAVGLRYSAARRFLQLERVAGDDDTGDRYTATVVMRF